jgi:hypothetical protein
MLHTGTSVQSKCKNMPYVIYGADYKGYYSLLRCDGLES